jgi:ABC-type cobalamin/Fe3+-siderophores transport system ATPase subunit
VLTEPFIPNDVYCGDESNMQVISGPNMSGKSTYIRMIALNCIMGQMGSFVPAGELPNHFSSAQQITNNSFRIRFVEVVFAHFLAYWL